MKNTDFRINLAQTQLETIENKLNRLIEHRHNIMDEVTLDDFSSQALFTDQPSNEDIMGLISQVKESVIEQRTLESAYRQSLLDFESELTELIQQYSDLKGTIESQLATLETRFEYLRFSVTMPNGNTIEEPSAIDTFIKVIEILGIDRIKALGIVAVKRRNLLLISDYEDSMFAQKRVGSYYVASGFSNRKKKNILEEIAVRLGVEITVLDTP